MCVYSQGMSRIRDLGGSFWFLSVLLASRGFLLTAASGDDHCSIPYGNKTLDASRILRYSQNKLIKDTDDPNTYAYKVNFCSGLKCSDTNYLNYEKVVVCHQPIGDTESFKVGIGDFSEFESGWLFSNQEVYYLRYKDDSGTSAAELDISIMDESVDVGRPNVTFSGTFMDQDVKTYYFSISVHLRDLKAGCCYLTGFHLFLAIFLSIIAFVVCYCLCCVMCCICYIKHQNRKSVQIYNVLDEERPLTQ